MEQMTMNLVEEIRRKMVVLAALSVRRDGLTTQQLIEVLRGDLKGNDDVIGITMHILNRLSYASLINFTQRGTETTWLITLVGALAYMALRHSDEGSAIEGGGTGFMDEPGAQPSFTFLVTVRPDQDVLERLALSRPGVREWLQRTLDGTGEIGEFEVSE